VLTNKKRRSVGVLVPNDIFHETAFFIWLLNSDEVTGGGLAETLRMPQGVSKACSMWGGCRAKLEDCLKI